MNLKKRWMVSFCLLLVLLCVSFLRGQTREVWHFVAPTGSGTLCSESSPCSLQYAAGTKAGNGDHIIMAPGTYLADDPGDDEVVYIDQSLSLWGGCVYGGGQPTVCSRDNPETIIDGQYMRRGIRIQGSPGNAVNVYLNYLKIQHGFAHGIDLSACTPIWGYPVLGCGGGLFADQAGMVNIYGSHFRENQASGNAVSGDVASFGGGIYIQDSVDVIFSSSQMIYNRATVRGIGYGGGMYVEGISGTVHIKEVLFQANESSMDDTRGLGGGLMINDCGRALVGYSTFHGNNQNDRINFYGSGAYLRFVETLQFYENEILVNWGGSAVSLLGTNENNHQYVYNNRFWDNATLYNLILEGDYRITVFNNFFHMSAPARVGRGGAVVNLGLWGDACTGSSTASILHNAFGVGQIGISVGDYITAAIKGNILANQAYMAVNVYGTVNTNVDIDTNLFYNNHLNGDSGTNPLNGDPAFVNAAMGDLHLQPHSAAIDQAPDFTLPLMGGDYDNDPRPVGLGPTPYDVGADEWCLQEMLPLIIND